MMSSPTRRRTVPAVALAALLAAGACDLPSSPDEARDRLSRGGRDSVTVVLPMPAVRLRVEELLMDPATGLAAFVDTADLSFRTRLDPLTMDLGALMGLELGTLPSYRHAVDLSPEDFRIRVPLELGALHVPIPERTFTTAMGPVSGGTLRVPVDLTGVFTRATLAGGSRVAVRLKTEGDARLMGARVAILDGSGRVLGEASGPVDVPAGSERVVRVPLGGRTLDGTFEMRFTFAQSGGNGSPADLTVGLGFDDVAVTAVEGVNRIFVPRVELSQTLPLEADDLGELVPGRLTTARIQSGQVRVTEFALGTLEFRPGGDFDGNLAGKAVGGGRPDSVTISGTVGAPSGVDRVSVTTSGFIEVEVRDLALASVTLENVRVAVDEVADWAGGQGGSPVTLPFGELTLEIENWLPVQGGLELRIEGVEGGTAAAPRTLQVPAGSPQAPGRSTVRIDLTNTTIRPGQLRARVRGTLAAGPITLERAQAERGLTVRPSLSVDVESLGMGPSGSGLALDRTLPLPLDASGVAAVADLLDGGRLEAAQMVVSAHNGTGVPLSLSGLELTLVDPASGQPHRGGSGQPLRIRPSGAAGPGGGGLTLPPGAPVTASGSATEAVNALLELLGDGREVAVRVTASARALTGGRLVPTDYVRFGLEFRGPLDMRLPAAGLRMSRRTPSFARLPGDVGSLVADLGTTLVKGTVRLEVSNGLPAGALFDLALAPGGGSAGSFQPFSGAPAVVLTGAEIPAPPVSGDGRPTGTAERVLELELTGDALETFRSPEIGLGLELRVTPPAGSPVVRLRKGDRVEIRPTVELRLARRRGAGS